MLSRGRRRGAWLCRRLGQVDDRPHQVRRRPRRPDQDHAGPASQGAAADPGARSPTARPSFEQGPLYLNTEARPWVQAAPGAALCRRQRLRLRRHQLPRGARRIHRRLPRRAGTGPAALAGRAAGLVALGPRRRCCERCERCRKALARGARPSLADLAACDLAGSGTRDAGMPILAVVATSLEDCRRSCQAAAERLQPAASAGTIRAASLRGEPWPTVRRQGRVPLPRPGIAVSEHAGPDRPGLPGGPPAARPCRAGVAGPLDRPLGKLIYPPLGLHARAGAAPSRQLTRTEVAQPAIGAASLALFQLLHALGMDAATSWPGHSYGEYVALCAAGGLDEEELLRLSHHRGQVIH